MKRHTVLRVIAKLLIPYLLLFALYVQFHGDYGPGGGFQAGVIASAAFILYALIFGLASARRVARSPIRYKRRPARRSRAVRSIPSTRVTPLRPTT